MKIVLLICLISNVIGLNNNKNTNFEFSNQINLFLKYSSYHSTLDQNQLRKYIYDFSSLILNQTFNDVLSDEAYCLNSNIQNLINLTYNLNNKTNINKSQFNKISYYLVSYLDKCFNSNESTIFFKQNNNTHVHHHQGLHDHDQLTLGQFFTIDNLKKIWFNTINLKKEGKYKKIFFNFF